MRLTTLLLALLPCATMAAEDFYVKKVEFPAQADSVTKIEMASRLRPSEKQLAWQDLELTAFIHFGVNTFTDREWGDGSESPEIFSPSDLDTEQWVKTLKDAGFKMVILTAKHHDGFCLWPTATTGHSVASSKWRGGKGDVVAELAESCRRNGMKLGLYLSPWDRNAPCYGDSPRYNDMFVAQLTELLTNYGTVDEVWFDGACGEGPNGKKQEYDWDRFKTTMETLQPQAVLAIMGDDVRWVGNEKGQGRETEWSATALTPGIYPQSGESNKKLGIFAKAPDLGGRDVVAKADVLYWWPSEVDVSIRPGWFYHDSEKAKSLRQLADIYLNSVGRNSVLLLNIPPDRAGRISAADSVRIAEFGGWIRENFGKAVTSGKVNSIVLKEDISKGQRVEAFNVTSGGREIARGTTVGHKRILMFEPVEAESVEVNILSSRGEANLLPYELFMVSMPSEDTAAAVPTISEDGATISTDGLTIILPEKTSIGGFIYMPDADAPVTTYKLMISDDGKKWAEVPATGEFGNVVNNPIAQISTFDRPVAAKYVSLVPLAGGKGRLKLVKP